ncbi:MAG: nucleoside triphosphate pyrophosphohydrolase [Deltaproteobacteria bacterium]|jgi:MazG family protein|nr:nucleoside triphosphate pyrophosphohydrolase [Deltaproteobacteria bacterium]
MAEAKTDFRPASEPSLTAEAALGRLNGLIEALVDPESGCPWDREQTTASLTEDLLEETCELREALRLDQGPGVLEEGGDLAFVLVFIAYLAEKKWGFGLKDMIDAVVDKMVSRHPHVFGDVQGIADSEGVLRQWHQIKRQTRSQGVLASVPVAMPALARCHRLSAKAARAGFDWREVAAVREALDRELIELDAEIAQGDFKNPLRQARLRHELGDTLMATANLARHLGFSGEKALDEANDRFVSRFSYMEKKLAEDNLKPEDVSSQELERLWQEAKRV